MGSLITPMMHELGYMDELPAAAAVVVTAVEDYAEADVEQRTLCGDDDVSDGCVTLRVAISRMPKNRYLLPWKCLAIFRACSTSLSVMARSRTP